MTPSFVDRKCPSCNGSGCEACYGGGLSGNLEPTPGPNLPEPNPWAHAVRKFRERSGMGIRVMGELISLTPSQWSELERGLRPPTEEQQAAINALMHKDILPEGAISKLLKHLEAAHCETLALLDLMEENAFEPVDMARMNDYADQIHACYTGLCDMADPEIQAMLTTVTCLMHK